MNLTFHKPEGEFIVHSAATTCMEYDMLLMKRRIYRVVLAYLSGHSRLSKRPPK
jgi:hypothetical protein